MNDTPTINPEAFLRRRRILELRAILREANSIVGENLNRRRVPSTLR
ncbi:MAG: hypothetical protein ABL901_10210 [Hyphomicrobiaceae bacterium]